MMKPIEASLRQVRDWNGLFRWAKEFKVPVEDTNGGHKRILVGGGIVVVANTPRSGVRALMNARGDILRRLR
jgi:hypothetical protein